MNNQPKFPETMRIEAESVRTKEMLMRIHLETIVPLLIHDIIKTGGVTEQDFARARNILAWDLAEGGDILLYRSKKKGETAQMMNKTAEGIAILSFCPGGITFLGLHFEASMPVEEATRAD